jgi:hypothetical protein
MPRDKQGRYKRPTELDRFIRLIGIADQYAFGAIIIFMFWTIVVKGSFGYEDNKLILWAEICLFIPIWSIATYNLVRWIQRLPRKR